MSVRNFAVLTSLMILSAGFLCPSVANANGYILNYNNNNNTSYFSNFQMPQVSAPFSNVSNMTVTINNFQFMPQTITVPAGSTVEWINQDSTAHTTTADNMSASENWDSGALQPGQTFSHTFNTAGTYTYHCNIHPDMKGTVQVVNNSQQTNTIYNQPQSIYGNGNQMYNTHPHKFYMRKMYYRNNRMHMMYYERY